MNVNPGKNLAINYHNSEQFKNLKKPPAHPYAKVGSDFFKGLQKISIS
jgi:hypothetical protein